MELFCFSHITFFNHNESHQITYDFYAVWTQRESPDDYPRVAAAWLSPLIPFEERIAPVSV